MQLERLGASFDGCFCSGIQYVVYYDGCSMRDFRFNISFCFFFVELRNRVEL